MKLSNKKSSQFRITGILKVGGSSALYSREGRTLKYHFKEAVKLVGNKPTSFPLVIKVSR